MQTAKRVCSLLLVLCMMLTFLPVLTFGEEGGRAAVPVNAPNAAGSVYTITFDANDPEGKYLAENHGNFTATYDDALGGEYTNWPYTSDGAVVNKANFDPAFVEKEGCMFKWWNTKPDGSGTSYMEDDLEEATFTGDTTLYAIWADCTKLTINVSARFEDGVEPETWALEGIKFDFSGNTKRVDCNGNSQEMYIYTYPSWDKESRKWTGTISRKLLPGEGLTLRESPYHSLCDNGYELTKVEYYVNGNKTPIVWSPAVGMPDVSFVLKEKENTVEVVNTYKLAVDATADGLTIRHQIDKTGWDSNDTAGHKADDKQPSIDYQLSLDLNSLTLQDSGKSKLMAKGGLKDNDSLWSYLKRNIQDIKDNGDLALWLCVSFDEEQVSALKEEDLDGIVFEHEWFECAAEFVDEDATESHDVAIVCYLDRSVDFEKVTPSDTLTFSGITLRLKAPLTEKDTDKSPRAIKTTAHAEGWIELPGGGSSVHSLLLSTQSVPAWEGGQNPDELYITGVEVTDTAKVYLVHEHQYDMKHDTTQHWKECACGDITGREAHAFGQWVVTKKATATKAGARERVCSVCGYKETGVIDATGNNTGGGTGGGSSTSSGSKTTKSPTTGDSSHMALWITLLSASALGAAGTVVYARKRKGSL